MSTSAQTAAARSHLLHGLGVISGVAAGAWLGAAEAPTKLVVAGFSPFIISLGMVSGVFVARWTIPTLLMGTGRIVEDLRARPHLVVWAVLAGMLWVVANTLTVFAIRDVGLSIAFPLWNTNSLIGLFWAWLLFNELRGASRSDVAKVAGGAVAIVAGACVLAYATSHQDVSSRQASAGIAAALGAGLLWGSMYIPYRKAYLSGMNPLSFVTVFTIGELATMAALAGVFVGGPAALARELDGARPAMFWLFLGGFCWVIGDLFQQYAAKYIGIGRGIPLSNTNQLWGLAWGALVFGELHGLGLVAQALIVAGSLVMIAGAIAISRAEASASEQRSWHDAVQRECDRYGLDRAEVEAALRGEVGHAGLGDRRHWWEGLVALAALAVFVWLGLEASRQPVTINPWWMALLSAATLVVLVVAVRALWARTRFA
jgi:drug/metabolite transporter (DMT)-like permease